jgi:L-alanine-DL-glutamate epimerase-like enolase superfamily enzyme
MLEIDSNPNPLRSLLSTPLNNISDGKITLTEMPGIGIDLDLNTLSQFLIH